MRVAQILLLLAFIGMAEGTTLRSMTLVDVMAEAETIFIGTVESTTSVQGGPPHDLLFTEVTFRDLEFLKGAAPVTGLKLRFGGGRVGNRRVVIPGMPQFAPGERVVLFANGKSGLCPAVGWHQGCFRVRDGLVEGPTGIVTLAAFVATVLEEVNR
jgi:hypothetical protein